jgi:hypothetical protein
VLLLPAKLLAEMKREGGALPEVVFSESVPFGIVPESNPPWFALYGDGRIIYRADTRFHQVQLNAAELRTLRSSLSAAREPALFGGYEVVQATDYPTNELLLYGKRPVFLSVYGSLNDQ